MTNETTPNSPKNWEDLNLKEKIEKLTQSRNSLRILRNAALRNMLSPEDMQNSSNETIKALGLLMSGEDTDQNLGMINSQLLNNFPQAEPKSNPGSKVIDPILMNMAKLCTRRSYLDRIGLDDKTLVMPLATGPLVMAHSSILNNFEIYVAAVDYSYTRDTRVVISPNIPKDKQILVMDDIAGTQANILARYLSENNYDVAQTVMGLGLS